VRVVNGRLRARQPELAAARDRTCLALRAVQQRFEGVRRFVEQGDGSPKVRRWLAELEQEEERREGVLRDLDTAAARPQLQVHPRKVARYLAELRGTLLKAGPRARHALQADVERIVIHSVRSETTKPFARAEVIASGKGLLSGVTFVVAGACSHRNQRPSPSRWT
jgi:hypothetical protein